MANESAHVAYLDDPVLLLARVGSLVRWAGRLTRIAPRMKAEDQRQECYRMIEVLLDRAEDLVRHAIASLRP